MRFRTYRLPDQPDVIPRRLGPRSLDQVPPAEPAALLRDCASELGWQDTERFFRTALHRLGRSRLTANAQQSLFSVLPLTGGTATEPTDH